MRVIRRTTKGKKDRMEFAATENAKVCTSVRIKYFRVERTRLWEGRGVGRRVRCRTASARGSVGMGGWDTGQFIVAEQGGAARIQGFRGDYRVISLSLLKLWCLGVDCSGAS